MNPAKSDDAISRASVWTGRVISMLACALLVMDGAMKLAKPAAVVDATRQLGYPESQVVGLGILLLACTTLYAIPRTAVIGAILLTGYLGGATASHVRIGAPAFNVTFAVLFGVLVWLGLWLRNPRVRALFVPDRA